MCQIIEANYHRLEARYYQIDFAELPLRKALNLAFDWFQEMIFGQKDGQEAWNRDWADVFDPPEEHYIREEFEQSAGAVGELQLVGGSVPEIAGSDGDYSGITDQPQ